MKSFFITSSGTHTGKTLTTCSLSWQMRQRGKTVTGLKPVISGYHPEDMNNDSAQILKSCGVTPTRVLMETISPWRYAAPIAPNMAAKREGNPVDFEALVQFCRDHEALETDYILTEGVGGVMAPLNNTHTVLDWMAALNWPVILVVGSYIGAISHALTAVEVLKNRGLTLHGIVICESEYCGVDLADTVATFENFLPVSVPLIKIPRVMTQDETWKHTPSISWICEPWA